MNANREPQFSQMVGLGAGGSPIGNPRITRTQGLVGLGLLSLLGVALFRPQRKKIFVSYDYDNDRRYRFLLSAWDANKAFAFTFEDHSTPLINSTSAGPIKAAISRKMQEADYLLVIVGRHTHRSRWVAWEIDKAKELKLKLIAVKIDRTYISPGGLLGAGATWAQSFTADGVARAVALA
jgi:hypothetical protein